MSNSIQRVQIDKEIVRLQEKKRDLDFRIAKALQEEKRLNYLKREREKTLAKRDGALLRFHRSRLHMAIHEFCDCKDCNVPQKTFPRCLRGFARVILKGV